MTFAETAKWLRDRDDFIILTHVRPDGDTLCTAAALASGLRRLGKKAYLLPNEGATERYLDHMADFFAPEGYEYKNVVSVDTAGERMFPENAKELINKVGLSIDHHHSNEFYAENTYVDGDRAACGEIVYEFIMELCGDITPREAELLYIAVSTDTGCFAYANTNADTFRVASALVAAGAPNAKLNKKFFRTKSKNRIALDGSIISGIRFFHDGQTAVATVTIKMLEDTGATENDLDDIANIPGQIEGVKCSITVRELADGRSKASLRTTGEVNASDVCAVFGGGGHPMAAGCTLEADTVTAGEMIAAEIGKCLK